MVHVQPSAIDDDAIDTILASCRGKSVKKPYSLIKNDNFCTSARKFVKENACRKGMPNLTVEMFRSWIDNEHECIVSKETARKWLHVLGFKQVNHQKGVYFDGHERDDVVAYRKQFLDKLTELDRRCIYGDSHFTSGRVAPCCHPP